MSDLKHEIFETGVFVKGLTGVTDLLGSLAVFLFGKDLERVVRFLFKWELTEDPSDVIGNVVLNFVQGITPRVEFFIAIYLLISGLVKIFLFIGLWKEKLWTYPITGFFLILFVVYEVFVFTKTHSLLLLIPLFLDVSMLLLLKSEHERAKRKKGL